MTHRNGATISETLLSQRFAPCETGDDNEGGLGLHQLTDRRAGRCARLIVPLPLGNLLSARQSLASVLSGQFLLDLCRVFEQRWREPLAAIACDRCPPNFDTKKGLLRSHHPPTTPTAFSHDLDPLQPFLPGSPVGFWGHKGHGVPMGRDGRSFRE
jgi:hypothetical protein